MAEELMTFLDTEFRGSTVRFIAHGTFISIVAVDLRGILHRMGAVAIVSSPALIASLPGGNKKPVSIVTFDQYKYWGAPRGFAPGHANIIAMHVVALYAKLSGIGDQDANLLSVNLNEACLARLAGHKHAEDALIASGTPEDLKALFDGHRSQMAFLLKEMGRISDVNRKLTDSLSYLRRQVGQLERIVAERHDAAKSPGATSSEFKKIASQFYAKAKALEEQGL